MSSETPKSRWVRMKQGEGATVLDETLQQQADPVAFLKEAGDKLAIVVPNEYGWPPELKPFQNPLHKWTYDTESLASDLEDAGFTYVIRLLEFPPWSFLTAECVRA